MTPDKVEKIDVAIANLLFAGLSIAQMEKIPKWLLENVEKNKDTFRTTLTRYHQDSEICGKEFEDGSLCGVTKDKCNCKEMSCLLGCTRNHTHKIFNCGECKYKK